MNQVKKYAADLYRSLSRRVLGERRFRRNVFKRVYAKGEWGSDSDSKFNSGPGSRGEIGDTYVRHMSGILAAFADNLDRPITIVDLGCGDFAIGRSLLAMLPRARYIGCDIVPELVAFNQQNFADDRVTFKQVDLVTDPLPSGDVCLVRQVLQHLSNRDIASFLAQANYDRLYVTEGQPETRSGPCNPDKLPGPHVRFDWGSGIGGGVQLDRSPFNMRTEEQFRVAMPGHEIIVTERVFIDAVT